MKLGANTSIKAAVPSSEAVENELLKRLLLDFQDFLASTKCDMTLFPVAQLEQILSSAKSPLEQLNDIDCAVEMAKLQLNQKLNNYAEEIEHLQAEYTPVARNLQTIEKNIKKLNGVEKPSANYKGEKALREYAHAQTLLRQNTATIIKLQAANEERTARINALREKTRVEKQRIKPHQEALGPLQCWLTENAYLYFYRLLLVKAQNKEDVALKYLKSLIDKNQESISDDLPKELIARTNDEECEAQRKQLIQLHSDLLPLKESLVNNTLSLLDAVKLNLKLESYVRKLKDYNAAISALNSMQAVESPIEKFEVCNGESKKPIFTAYINFSKVSKDTKIIDKLRKAATKGLAHAKGDEGFKAMPGGGYKLKILGQGGNTRLMGTYNADNKTWIADTKAKRNGHSNYLYK